MINKLQILANIEHFFHSVLMDEDSFNAVNAHTEQATAYQTRLKELMIRLKNNDYLSCSFAANGKLVSNINFNSTPLVTAFQDLIPNTVLPHKNIALEFEIRLNETLKPAQQNGFAISQVLILADQVENEQWGSLIRTAYLYQIHNFTTGQKHYTISPKDIYINTNSEVLRQNHSSVLLVQNGDKLAPITAHEYQNLSSEISSVSSFLQWLIALSCTNVELVKGIPPSRIDNEKRRKKNKPILRQYYDLRIVTANKVQEKCKWGEIYNPIEGNFWVNK